MGIHLEKLRSMIGELAVDEKVRGKMLYQLDALDSEHQAEKLEARQRAASHSEKNPTVRRAVHVLFRDPDGRRIIERAHASDAVRTERELNYIGGHAVAGELSVAKDLAIEQYALRFATGARLQ